MVGILERAERGAPERALRGLVRGLQVQTGQRLPTRELHGLDPEAYLLDIIHVVPYWPRDRYLELAPKYWTATRGRISERELEIEVGDITVPPPLPAPEQTASR